MNDQERLLLLHKRWTGSISSEELARLEGWLASDEAFRKEAKSLESLWKKAADVHSSYQPDTNRAWERFHSEMNSPARVFRLSHVWRVAAALVLLVAVIGLLRYQFSPDLQYLTTSNSIYSDFELPDGSIVWLNQFSRLEYPAEFDQDIRLVHLQGEAYFEVESNLAHPFVVNTSHGQVKVTGTIFNVRSYANEEDFEAVFLKSGEVTYRENKNGKEVKLSPGNKVLHYPASSQLNSQPDPMAVSLYWKEGKLKFEDEKLKDILVVMEAYFNVKFDTGGVKPLLNCIFSADLTGRSLKESLIIIHATTRIRFNQMDANVYQLNGGIEKICD